MQIRQPFTYWARITRTKRVSIRSLQNSPVTSHLSLLWMVSETRCSLFEEEGGKQDLPLLEVTLTSIGVERRLLVLQDLRLEGTVTQKRRDFVANASHELKTPIAALVGLLDLIDDVPEDKRKDLLDRARRDALGISNLVNGLLALTHAESPDWRLSPSVLDLSLAVLEVTDGLQERALDKQLELVATLPSQPTEIFADAFALRMATQNLVLNAVIYIMSGTGPGLDPKILPRIFERIFRGDIAHFRASWGTGLDRRPVSKYLFKHLLSLWQRVS